MNKLSYTVGSNPDHECLVADIFSGDTQIAEVFQDDDSPLMIEIYPPPSGDAWLLDLGDLLNIMNAAIDRLKKLDIPR